MMHLLQSRCRRTLPILAALMLVSGCGKKDEPFRKETIQVTGQILVDGQPPGSPIQISCHDLNGMDQEHPSVSQANSESDGQFVISTYEAGDGVPPGDYALTFTWGEFNMVSMSFGGADKLNKRYNEVGKSEVRFQVKSGDKPLDLGTIELSTK
jgi:hypothetical protein